FMASGAGNGPSSVTAARTSPDRWPSARLPPTWLSWSYRVSLPALPDPDAAWYDAATISARPNSRCSAASTTIIDSVVQLGTAMIPRGRLAAAAGLTSGTTRGTSGSSRNAPDLSMTTTPRAAATGAQSAETSSGTSNMARSTPSNASAVSSRTVTSVP